LLANFILKTKIIVDGNLIESSNNIFHAVAECGSEQSNINVIADPAATVEINGMKQNSQIVSLFNYGNNIFSIKINSQDYTLIVVRYYNHIVYEYPDVPTINCNQQTNGGYDFRAFQWYRNNAAISGANNPYYRISDNATYYCEITLSNGDKWRTCSILQTTNTTGRLMAYPNPTQGQITINSSDEQLSTGKMIQVFDIFGRLVLHSTTNSFDMSVLSDGVYVIKVNNETVRVVVKK